ncbi:hypothetical protein DFP72DRAFT_901422 [Ephemerocybe angulata]|uniref:Uncharacterized protein n=1 Tax=Ephemerocybe angulata TaxID=980116 RepID=A0A8H6M5G6_9AGAR|nr:hypothetical protein DFP72DRAFT_901422 [Tulosesus angulatus]
MSIIDDPQQQVCSPTSRTWKPASWILGALAIPVRPQLAPIDTSGREQNNDWWDKLPSGKEEPVTSQSANCAGKDCHPKLQNSKIFRLPPKQSPWSKIKKGFNTVLSKVGLRPKTTTGRNVPATNPTRSAGGAVPKAPASVNVKKPGPAKKGGSNRSNAKPNAKGAQGSRGGKAGGPRKAAPVKGKGKAPTRKAAPSKAQARPAAPRKARAPGKAKPAGRK